MGRLSHGPNFVTGWGVKVARGCSLQAGTRVSIGADCKIMANVALADDIMISSGVAFVGRDHPLGRRGDSLYDYPKAAPAVIDVGKNVLIGFGAIIVGPCVIGDNSVIASGAVVTKDVEDDSIVGGVPAARIKGRWE